MDTADLPVIAELHVDDLALEAGAAWLDAARLLEAVGELALGVDARLSFRFRRRFAEDDARQGGRVLRRLEAMGHEIGTHAHGRGLTRAKRAVDATGVANQAATPGMVQAKDPARLWRRTAELGFAWITDHPAERAWTYGGLLPWRPGADYRPDQPALGPVMIATSADPFAWGLLRRGDGRVEHQWGLDAEHFQRLEGLFAAHRAPLPEGSRPYFSFALHEHNLCRRGSLQPLSHSLEALEAFLGRHRVVPAGEVASSAVATPLAPRSPAPRPQRFAHRVRMASQPLRRRLPRRGAQPAGPFTLCAGRRRLHALWLGPSVPRGVLLLSHAGVQGGTRTLLRPFGLDPKGLLAQGLAVVAYDRSGTGRSPLDTPLTPGNRVHVQDFRAAITAVRERVGPDSTLGVMSFSSGILPPLRAGEPFDFLLDGEAPADRWSLRPPPSAAAPRDETLRHLPMDQDEPWEGREPAGLLHRLCCPYHRLQAEYDHVHGRLDQHARLMIEAARAAALPRVLANGEEELRVLPGRLHAHGPLIERWIVEAFEGGRRNG
jgi:hypothetical protein